MGQDRAVFKEIETTENAKYAETRFSHIVTFYGVKCLYSEDDATLLPIGNIRKRLFGVVAAIHEVLSSITSAMMPGFEPAYPLRVVGIITKQETFRGSEE